MPELKQDMPPGNCSDPGEDSPADEFARSDISATHCEVRWLTRQTSFRLRGSHNSAALPLSAFTNGVRLEVRIPLRYAALDWTSVCVD